MWIHSFIFLGFCALFLCAKGLFLKSGNYLAGKIPSFMNLTGRQIRVCLLAVFFGNLLGMAVTVVSMSGQTGNIYLLERKEDVYTEDMYVSDGTNREKIQIEVRPEPYTDEEKAKILENAEASLAQDILGKNTSLDKVEYPLNLMTEIPGTEIQVIWDTDQPLILDWEGQIGEEVSKTGTVVTLQAELVLDDCRRTFETKATVFPLKKTESEQMADEIQKEIERQNELPGEYLSLPEVINDTELTWTRADRYQGLLLTGMAILTGILLVLSEKSRKKQKLENRRGEMQRDYPGILSKMILLMQAGVSSRKAIQKIALDYKWDKECGRPCRAAYEEILKVYLDLEQGVPEEVAYRNIGNRCDLLCYRTFSTLLVQNLKKGSSYFISALKQECTEAFEKRKSDAIVRGEQAGTKLLIPMGCMLLIVLLIILVPSMMALG